MTQTLPAWLPAVIAGGLVTAAGFAVVGVASAAVDWLWPQEGQEAVQAGAGGPGTPSQDSRDAGTAPKPSGGHTAIRNDSNQETRMDRIYANHIDGQRRIHIEIAENEVADLLDDLTPGPDAFDATYRLIEILRVAHADFAQDSRNDAVESANSRT